MLKDFVHQYLKKRGDLKERYINMNSELPKKFLFQQFHYRCFSVHCWKKIKLLVTALGNVHIVQTHETQNASNQTCFTANKRSRCSNQTGRYLTKYRMYL